MEDTESKEDSRAMEDERAPAGLRTCSVLEALVKAGVPMTATAINETLQLPKATIHRLCQRLEDEGWLDKDIDGRRYMPGRRLRLLATGVISFTSFAQARTAILQRLSEQIGETCNIAIPGRAGMRYLDRVETRWPLRVQLPIGGQVPFYCTASGKLYLSTLRKSQQRKLVESLSLDKRAPNTITNPAALLSELDRIRSDRIGTDNEELAEGMVAIAVPINDERGRLAATLAVHGPTQRMSFKDVLGHAPLLREAAGQLRAVMLDLRQDGDNSDPRKK